MRLHFDKINAQIQNLQQIGARTNGSRLWIDSIPSEEHFRSFRMILICILCKIVYQVFTSFRFCFICAVHNQDPYRSEFFTVSSAIRNKRLLPTQKKTRPLPRKKNQLSESKNRIEKKNRAQQTVRTLCRIGQAIIFEWIAWNTSAEQKAQPKTKW